ncbi:glutamate receptor ionotropic, kainate 2-like isoform X3 [Ruditapes philippinarum]|uniref:glutamate receptor ionotropic, kainate 2-like isoform X3 n=1 Tax=Ruditapes philippinarum TaxID=129788 RepID=UPI00295BFDAD|nr:glutamate receptor ionotropic, kainate 2-like isoform X3 [Ruditapes philippinarum]
MRALAQFGVLVVWSSLAVLAHCRPINVGVLNSSYQSWIDILQQYGRINGSTHIETYSLFEKYTFTSLDIEKEINTTRRANLVAVVGQYNRLYSSLTDHLRIPYFITSSVPRDEIPSPFHIQMIPDLQMYTRAIRDLFEHYRWKNAGVLYNTENGASLAALMMEHLNGKSDLYDIRAYDVQLNSSAEVVRWALKDLRRKLVTNFLIICSPEVADIVLTQALYLSLLSRPNSWLIVTLGSGDIEMSQYIDSRANLTLLRLMVDPQTPHCALPDSEISLTKALYYDVFRIINGTYDVKTPDDEKDKISRSDLRRQVKTQIDINGCTGPLNFTRQGKRNETYLQMIALEGLVDGADEAKNLSGTWYSGGKSTEKRVQPSRSYSTMLSQNNNIFADRILRVTTLIEPPFIQWKNKTPEEGLTMGNDKFEGFCKDIIDEIAKMLNFQYNLSVVPDRKFGSLKPPPRYWTGMIRHLLDDKADVALAPFSITPDRSAVVDFTKPFMTKGTSVVVRKPERSVWPFQFLSPLSKIVWIAIFLSFIFVGLFLFVVTRITNDDKTDFRDDLKMSFWYVWGTLLRADLSGSPLAMSGRIISATWWFFSLIIISIYTANLAAFLTISNAHIPISSAADLANQDEYNYGTVEDGQIESFFNNTRISHYEQMRAYMIVYNPDSKVKRVEHGFARAMKEKYAFIWDSPTVRHETANNCDLMEIGTPFDLKGYGIATQKHSKYSEPLSMAVLALNDNGILYRLEGKWWRRPNCPDPRSNAKSKEIEIEVASGMFIVLLGGIILSAVVCVIQYIVHKHCKLCRKLFAPREPEIQSNHNHVTTSLEDHVDETTVVLSRTLSIGENCVNTNKWENNHACANSSVT